jgi:hypothetical protein
MIDVDLAGIYVYGALSLTLVKPLLTKPRAQRNYIERTKILPATRDHELHGTEPRVVLASVE